MPVLICGSETMVWEEKERFRISAIHIDNFRDLLGIRRIYKVLNAWIKELCKETKGVDERIDEGIL